MKTVLQHLKSLLSCIVIALSLVIWLIPLILLGILNKLPVTGLQRFARQTINHVYRYAVGVNSFWLERVMAIDLVIHGQPPNDPDEQMIVVCNHRSWFDILLVQDVVTSHGPRVNFLVKRELAWVPIVGWICLALGFPMLARGGSVGSRNNDIDSIANAADELNKAPAALLNFAEGTRFTDAKHLAQVARYQHLLNPKAGGLRIMLRALENVRVLDMTIIYPDDDVSFWDCMGGRSRRIEIVLEYFNAAEISNPTAWINSRWQEKDQLIDQSC
jgi:1-acyl-sn-glycerol-3-phosphate acyltransferase